MFEDWVERPDASGRMHLEAPNLPADARWWAKIADFESLPTPDEVRQQVDAELCERAIRLRAASGLPPRDIKAEGMRAKAGLCTPSTRLP